MSKFLDSNITALKANDAFTDMMELLNKSQREAVSSWLDALELQQVSAMRDCKVEMLPENRIRMAQLAALSNAVLTGSTTGHVF